MSVILRPVRWALRSFFRHLGLSFITIIIITFSLLSLNILLFINTIGRMVAENLQNKVDMNIYLNPNLNQADIDFFKNELAKEQNIDSIEHIAADQALANFRQKHQDNEFISKSLAALDANPFGGMIIIRATSLEAYPEVVTTITSNKYSRFIEDKDFFEHQKIILIIENLSEKIYLAGLVILLIFTFISVVAIFNSIRLTFYTRKDEIKIMRLIGATGSFARAPLIIENVLYGVFAWLINLIIFILIFNFGLNQISSFLEIEKEVFISYSQEMIYSFLMVLIFSIFLTIVSSWLATRKYIRA